MTDIEIFIVYHKNRFTLIKFLTSCYTEGYN